MGADILLTSHMTDSSLRIGQEKFGGSSKNNIVVR